MNYKIRNLRTEYMVSTLLLNNYNNLRDSIIIILNLYFQQ